MVAQFQLKVFGSPQLVRGSRSLVRFRTKKHLAVLLYLHFEGRARSIPRDQLVDLLWPDVPAEKGRHSLSQALLAIRSRLGTDAVTGREQEVQLLAELPSDLSTLRQGEVATVRVTEPLQGLDDCAGVEFAHWVDGARVRLKAQARDALRAALQETRAKGNLSETHRLAAALYDVDPLCTDAVYALAERALLGGDTVAAVRLLKDQVRRAQAPCSWCRVRKSARAFRMPPSRSSSPRWGVIRRPAGRSRSGWLKRAECVRACGRSIPAFPQLPTRPPIRFACAWLRP